MLKHRNSFIVLAVLMLVCLTLLSRGPRAAAADDNQTIFKTSIQVTTAPVKSVKHADGMWYDDYWHWAPRIKFNVQGPLAGGSQLSTEFFLPGNQPWVKYDCKTPDLAAGKVGNIECGFGLSDRELKGSRTPVPSLSRSK
jgi:hypothetical protein